MTWRTSWNRKTSGRASISRGPLRLSRFVILTAPAQQPFGPRQKMIAIPYCFSNLPAHFAQVLRFFWMRRHIPVNQERAALSWNANEPPA